jgi:hypothetical protein
LLGPNDSNKTAARRGPMPAKSRNGVTRPSSSRDWASMAAAKRPMLQDSEIARNAKYCLFPKVLKAIMEESDYYFKYFIFARSSIRTMPKWPCQTNLADLIWKNGGLSRDHLYAKPDSDK